MGLKFSHLLCNRVKCERINVSLPSGPSFTAELFLWTDWETLSYRVLLAFLDLTVHNVQ